MIKTFTAISAMIKPMIESDLPDWVEPLWFSTKDEAMESAPMAEIGWFDMYKKADMAPIITHAANLKWLNSIYAGVDGMPLDILQERGVIFTNGTGINAISIAEYVVMGMLNMAKGFRDVIRAQERREWLLAAPAVDELYGSKALLVGYGAIGKLIALRLAPFGVETTIVRRTATPDTLGPNEWQARLGEFDWVILAVPATSETEQLIGAAELATMKNSAVLINIARGEIVDQPALVEALKAKSIGGAFLDVTTPEPLPAEHELWTLDNAHITMHLSGRGQEKMFQRAAERFLLNLGRYERGERLEPQVNLKLGY